MTLIFPSSSVYILSCYMYAFDIGIGTARAVPCNAYLEGIKYLHLIPTLFTIH